ncbi:MAG: AAA family ATPase [Magnetococcales bacterium]|nr:AAA family ATPase [Magnetococcales bacterium]
MHTSPPKMPLTERQGQILRLVQMGRSNKEVARELSISEGTVKQHLFEVYRRLNVTNRTMAAEVGRRAEGGSLFLPSVTEEVVGARPKSAKATKTPPVMTFPRFTAAMQRVTVLRVVVRASETLVNLLGSRGFARFNHLFREVCQQESSRFGSVVQGVPDGVLLLFGIPHLREDDPERAACCAARIFERTRRIWQDELDGMEFPVQVCLMSGDLVVNTDGEKTTLHGALLLQACETLPEPCQERFAPCVDQVTRQAIHTLAGRYGWIPLPLPTEGVESSQASVMPFFGRTAELAALRDRKDLLLQGKSRAVLVLGEAGFGKTRLIDNFRAECSPATPVRWLSGVCRPAARCFPLHPFLPVLETVAGCANLEEPILVRRERLRHWIATLPGSLSQVGQTLLDWHEAADPATVSNPDMAKVVAAADFISDVLKIDSVSTVLLMDNLQWADAATRALLPLLVERLNGSFVWLLGAGRKAELRQLATATDMDALSLPKLSTRFLADLLRLLLPEKFVADAVLFRLARWCRGVPLFAVDIAAHLRRVTDPTTVDALDDNLLFPLSLQGLILERLQDAGIDWRTARAIAAGGKVTLSQLLALELHGDPALTKAAVARLSQVGLLESSGMGLGQTLTFTNGMVRAAIWHTLPAGDRTL